MSKLPSATEPPTLQVAPSSASASEFATPDTSRAATPVSSAVEKAPDESSKLKTLLGILKRFIGVSDIAAVRFSLPAQLLEPIPNLEYWHYLDRPDAFCAIGDSDDPLGRMLQCLRYWFTKDLKYVKGKPVKPYNSALGEFFRCQWEVDDASPALLGKDTKAAAGSTGKVKVNYLTEQTSHHPPVSAYYIDCPEKGISAYGFDQISAKFTGTSIKVVPGNFNLGIYIKLHKWGDEEYHLTHPTAYLGGLLRGSLNVTVGDICVIECPKTGLKVLLQYIEEGWLGKNQNRVQGVIYKCDVATDKTARLKDVSEKDIVGRIEGAWHDRVWFSPGSVAFDKAPEKSRILLIDNTPLYPIPKTVPPVESQLPNESRKFWAPVTEAIQTKQFSLATSAKQEIEERQRTKAADRAAKNAEWKPRYFSVPTDPTGRPTLSAEGRSALNGLQKGEYALTPGQD